MPPKGCCGIIAATLSGIEVKSVYCPDDLGPFDYARLLGHPGSYPFTRGIEPEMYRKKLWVMREYSGFASARDSNLRYRYLLEQGMTGLSIALDLPTQIGYDCDAEAAKGHVGKVGVPIYSLEDMEVLLEGIPLETVSIHISVNATAPIIAAMFIIVARRHGADLGRVVLQLHNDPLKEFTVRGTYRFPPKPSLRLAMDLCRYLLAFLPNSWPLTICGNHMRAAGATAAQEVGFALANGIAYLEAAREAGIDVELLASRVRWLFSARIGLFEEVAKIRAVRRLWARIVRDRFHTKNPASWMLRLRSAAQGMDLTAQEPENNIVRTTIQTLVGVLAGAQEIDNRAYDEAYGLPTEETAKLALRTQQVIAHETDVACTVDPLGGSYFVEWLTSRLEEEAEQYIRQVDSLGGAAEAIEKGYIQRVIDEASYRQQRAIESGSRVIVGLNRFASERTRPLKPFRVDAEAEKRVHPTNWPKPLKENRGPGTRSHVMMGFPEEENP